MYVKSIAPLLEIKHEETPVVCENTQYTFLVRQWLKIICAYLFSSCYFIGWRATKSQFTLLLSRSLEAVKPQSGSADPPKWRGSFNYDTVVGPWPA